MVIGTAGKTNSYIETHLSWQTTSEPPNEFSWCFIFTDGNNAPHRLVTQLVFLIHCVSYTLNTLRPRQDERHFADDIFTCIFFNENCCIFIKFSLKYVRKGPIDNNPALGQIMAWRRSGDMPLSEPMTISLPTHICVTRPQWVNTLFCIMMYFCAISLDWLTYNGPIWQYATISTLKINSVCSMTATKRKCHFDEIFITGCTGICQNDKFQCSQWWKFR